MLPAWRRRSARSIEAGVAAFSSLTVSAASYVRRVSISPSVSRTWAPAVRLSAAALSRIERGLTPGVPLVRLAALLEVVGLELSARAFPGGQPLRDVAHVRLLAELRRVIDPLLRWATEVPLPGPRDRRSWDAVIGGHGWRYGVEAETAPRDSQALARRIQLKQRDGSVDGVILLLRSSRRTTAFLAEAGALLEANLPVDGRRALSLLAAGAAPGGSAIILVRVPRCLG